MNNETRKETQVLPKDVRYVGADDLTLPLFENQYPVQPMGVSYNSYLIPDEKVAVMDSVDARAARLMRTRLEEMKDLRVCNAVVSLRSALSPASEAQMETLSAELCAK